MPDLVINTNTKRRMWVVKMVIGHELVINTYSGYKSAADVTC